MIAIIIFLITSADASESCSCNCACKYVNNSIMVTPEAGGTYYLYGVSAIPPSTELSNREYPCGPLNVGPDCKCAVLTGKVTENGFTFVSIGSRSPCGVEISRFNVLEPAQEQCNPGVMANEVEVTDPQGFAGRLSTVTVGYEENSYLAYIRCPSNFVTNDFPRAFILTRSCNPPWDAVQRAVQSVMSSYINPNFSFKFMKQCCGNPYRPC